MWLPECEVQLQVGSASPEARTVWKVERCIPTPHFISPENTSNTDLQTCIVTKMYRILSFSLKSIFLCGRHSVEERPLPMLHSLVTFGHLIACFPTHYHTGKSDHVLDWVLLLYYTWCSTTRAASHPGGSLPKPVMWLGSRHCDELCVILSEFEPTAVSAQRLRGSREDWEQS